MLLAALEAIGNHPALGSSRLEVELGIPGVRLFALRTYPYVIIYFDTPEFVDVRHVRHYVYADPFENDLDRVVAALDEAGRRSLVVTMSSQS